MMHDIHQYIIVGGWAVGRKDLAENSYISNAFEEGTQN